MYCDSNVILLQWSMGNFNDTYPKLILPQMLCTEKIKNGFGYVEKLKEFIAEFNIRNGTNMYVYVKLVKICFQWTLSVREEEADFDVISPLNLIQNGRSGNCETAILVMKSINT